ncbi:MAG TPA: NrfD/PsrC family molybdoenzyme membrane anchor subunit [Chloroflexota bacterium]|nr:NrfD/PsrC family molybdoenzyme membrane anchor subunit [Chloroflexota bacterium]
MQERQALSARRIDHDLLGFVLHTPLWFWIAAGVLGLLVSAFVGSVGLLVLFGLQLLGYTNVQYWTIFITHFVFWVGISHAGVMISAILRLTQAEWRRPITRCAEVLAIFSLITAAMFPLIHTGRLWRTAYWAFPYDFTRGIWPDVRSALIWDPSAIVTYLTGTALFVFVDLLPDLAVARDRSTGLRHHVYRALALGFHGSARQWRLQLTAGILLSALILPVFVSVHSIVAWDFAMAIQPGWHSTILAPYFVIGAVHSGVAAVVTTMIILRRFLHLDKYITLQHFDTIGRLQLVVWFGYLFFFLMDFYFGLFARDPVEVSIWELRLTQPPTNILLFIQVLTALIIPLPFWFSRRCRRNVSLMFWLSISVNVGMFLERYILVVTPLSVKQPFVYTWSPPYQPQVIEYVITIGSFALASFGLLLFAKVFPIIPLWDVKEGQVNSQEVQVGRREVPAAIHD